MCFKHKNGFTLVELMVTVSIVSLLMATILFNYSTFTDNLALSSAEQEVSVAIRQAQTYGINVRESSVSSGVFDYGYGVYFDPTDNGNYYLFVDSNGDKKYTPGNGCGSGSTECVSKFTLRNNVKISNVCDPTTCYNTKTLNITFLRPIPDANVYLFNSDGTIYSGPITTGKIELTSAKGKVARVTIENTGQIVVQ